MSELGQSEEKKAGLSPLERSIFSDYKLSFAHAQGGYEAQERMFIDFSTHYTPSPDLSFPTLRKDIQRAVDELWIPHRHTETIKPQDSDKERELTPTHIVNELNYRWDQYAQALGHFLYGIDIAEEDMLEQMATYESAPQDFTTIIASDMVKRDLEFQRKGRPKATTEQKKWESFIRKHAVEGVSTGNPRIDNYYQLIQQALNEAQSLDRQQQYEDIPPHLDLVIALSDLAQEWETHHPGQTFYGDNPSTEPPTVTG